MKKEEFLRLQKDRKAIDRFVDNLLSKFSSPGYWMKAPKEVIESDLEKYFDKSTEWKLVDDRISDIILK